MKPLVSQENVYMCDAAKNYNDSRLMCKTYWHPSLAGIMAEFHTNEWY